MESATFRKWLMEHGCRFGRRPSGGKGKKKGHAVVTVQRANRKVALPLVGSRKSLPKEVVYAIMDGLGLDRAQLPGSKSRV